MENQNYLGIHLSKSRATVVCLSRQGGQRSIIGCFTVPADSRQDRIEMPELAKLIGEGCAQRELVYSDAAVALDCSMFMQHGVHSEFRDPKQIAQTVRFDTEEMLATDISDVALAFKIVSSDETGSQLSVYTAKRESLSDIILALQSNNMDPVTVEPDVDCLSRFVREGVEGADDSHLLFAILSGSSGYLIGPGEPGQVQLARTLLVSANQDRPSLLARQIPLTIAQLEGEPINRVKIFDPAAADYQNLGERLGLEIEDVDLLGAVTAEPQVLADCQDKTGLAVAVGAALALSWKERVINFREDHMPYQGKKMRMRRALRFLSLSVSILMFALGTYFTSQLLRASNYRSALRAKFQPQYAALMSGQKLPGKLKEANRRLGTLKRRILAATKVTGEAEESLAGRLMLLFQAFNNNKCAERTKLEIDSINITENTIRIRGSTAGRGSIIRLRQELEAVGLKVSTDNVSAAAGRDNFSMTIALHGGKK